MNITVVRGILICLLAMIRVAAQAQTLGEALNATNLTWTTAGNSPWFSQTNVTHDGVAAARNGAITNRQSSILQTTITGPGTLAFWWEIAFFDQGPCRFVLAIDGVEQTSTFGGGWLHQTNYLGDGDHLVQWVFTNFLASGTLQDAGIVDQVSFIQETTAPVITIQPVSQSQAPALDSTFTVTATGTPPLNYQWRFNGTNIPGAESASFTRTNMQSSSSGTYSVIVSNVAGAALSSNADLSLVPVASWPGINNVPPGATNVLAIAVGEYFHGLALRADGTVIGWGSDSYGQATAPIGLTNAIAIAAGEFHSLALKADGTVIGWGRDDYGQISIPAEATNIVAIAAGGNHSLALKADGTVAAWGNNSQGESNIPNDLSNIVAISSGLAHNLALRDDGRIMVWGSNFNGATNVPSGLTNAVAIAAGFTHNLALTTEGAVVAWGDGYAGATNVPAGLSNVFSISAGTFSSLAVKADGTVVAWGSEPPVPSGLKNVLSVAAGGYNLALVADRPPILHAAAQNPERSANSFSVSIPSQCGHVYRLEYLTSLNDRDWTPLPLRAGDGRLLSLTDPTPNDPQRFYRIRQW